MTSRTIFIAVACVAAVGHRVRATASAAKDGSAASGIAAAQDGDIATRVVALLGDTRNARAAAAVDPRTPARKEDLVAGLRDAIRAGDAQAAAAFVDRWFQEVADPARAVLDAIAANPQDAGDVAALGILLAGAMVHAGHGSAAVQPWTAESLASAALELFPEGEGAARALRMGLAPSGPMLPGRLLGEILRVQAEGVGALSIAGQLECMSLADDWAKTMPQEAEAALLDVFAHDGSDPFAKGQAVKLLLRRDWRVFAETLVDVHLARHDEDADPEDSLDVIHHLTRRAHELTHSERMEYAKLLMRDEGTAANLAAGLSQEDAVQLLAQPGSHLPPAARRWLELKGGAGAWLEAGIELLDGDTGHPNLSWTPALATLVERGASGDPAFEAALRRRFDRRAQGREAFWGAMRVAADAARDRATLTRTFVPLIHDSSGEAGAARRSLVALLRERLADDRLE